MLPFDPDDGMPPPSRPRFLRPALSKPGHHAQGRTREPDCPPLQKLPREVLLTGRTEHLKYFAARLQGAVKNVFVLKGGMGKRQRQSVAEALAQVPENEPRVILATGSYLGEGFDDARLDTLFLALPISWRGTLQQYVGRLHRIHDNKRVVEVYDYVDADVPVLARMYERRLKGHAAIGYTVADQVSNTLSPTTSVGH